MFLQLYNRPPALPFLLFLRWLWLNTWGHTGDSLPARVKRRFDLLYRRYYFIISQRTQVSELSRFARREQTFHSAVLLSIKNYVHEKI